MADPDVPIAKSLYIDMMTTTEYADFKASMSAFNTKLKHNTVSFQTKTEWMNWINDSISVTNFTDKIEFETMYDDMIYTFGNMVKANEDLFEYIADSEADQLYIIYQPEYESGAIPVTTAANPFEESAMDWFDGVAELLLAVWNTSDEIAGNILGGYPAAYDEALANNEAAYWRAYISNALLFDQLMASC